MRKRRNTLISPNKYELGDFVTKNQQSINAGINGVATLGSMSSNPVVSSAATGLASGASLGTAVMPGIGTAIGAVGGALFGAIGGGRKKQAQKDAFVKQEGIRRNLVYDQFESDINTVNENPYGIYEDGGKVKKGNLAVNTGSKKIINKSGVKPYDSGSDPLYPDGNRQFNMMNAGFELLDPTGASGFSDAVDAIQDPNTPTNIKFLETMGALPYMNKLNKLGILGKGIYTASNTPEIAQLIGGTVPQKDDSNARRIVKNSLKRYADGGEVIPNIINIEKGELQINPENGKIIREFTGINPETGGLYEPHSDGQDTPNNLVNAEEGTFIISKDHASKYKDALKNNDKLYQNSIMQNIRNRKKSLTPKFADGGDINRFNPIWDDMNLYSLPQTNIINSKPYTPVNLNPLNNSNNSNIDVSNNNIMDRISDVADYGLGFYNIARGLSNPETQPYRLTRPSTRNRQNILNNIPDDLSINPVLNEILGNSYSNRSFIMNNTSNPSIARALIQAGYGDTNRAINDAYYQNANINTDRASRRASIYGSLAQADEALNAQNAASMLNTDETNRQIRLAKENQFNTGLSQLQEVAMNKRSIRDQRRNDRLRLRLLQDTNPYLKYYSGNWMDDLDIR